MTTSTYDRLIYRLLPVVILLASCTASYKTLTIETARPSSDLLPEQIKSLTLMNRSITDDFRNFEIDSIQKYFFKNDFNVSAVVLDSMAADTTLKVLGELLFESGRYDIVIPEERNFTRKLKYNKIPDELDWNNVNEICREFNTDALLVIERYFNKLITDYTIHPALLGYEQYVSASIDSKYDVVVKVYDPEKKEIIRQLIVADTISWFDTDLTTERLLKKLPTIKVCLIQTGIQAALELDSKLSPTWVKEIRSYFLLEKTDADRINEFANNNDWNAAYDYWLPYTKSAINSIKSKAEFNMALASEMLGNIDDAIEWANKSYFTKYHKQTENYLYKLKARNETLLKFQQVTQ